MSYVLIFALVYKPKRGGTCIERRHTTYKFTLCAVPSVSRAPQRMHQPKSNQAYMLPIHLRKEKKCYRTKRKRKSDEYWISTKIISLNEFYFIFIDFFSHDESYEWYVFIHRFFDIIYNVNWLQLKMDRIFMEGESIRCILWKCGAMVRSQYGQNEKMSNKFIILFKSEKI